MYTPQKSLHHLYYIHFSPKFCKLLGKLIMFIDKTLKDDRWSK